MVGRLAESVRDFHERFGLVGPSSEAELLSRIPIQDEEVRELHEAVLSESPERVAEEATDVLFVAIGTMLRLDPELAAQALRQVIEKNDAKTKETHPHQPRGQSRAEDPTLGRRCAGKRRLSFYLRVGI